MCTFISSCLCDGEMIKTKCPSCIFENHFFFLNFDQISMINIMLIYYFNCHYVNLLHFIFKDDLQYFFFSKMKRHNRHAGFGTNERTVVFRVCADSKNRDLHAFSITLKISPPKT